MGVAFAVILVILALIGTFYFVGFYKGKVKATDRALTLICASGVITMLICAVLCLLTERVAATIAYTLYLIFYALTIYAFVRFAYLYSTNKKRDIFLSPFFYGTVVIILMLFFNIFSHDTFTVTFRKFGTDMFPSIIRGGMFFLYIAYLSLESIIVSMYVISSIIKSPRLYRTRYILILSVIVFHQALEYVSFYYDVPPALKSMFLLPEGLFMAYLCSSYSTRKLTSSVLTYVSDNDINGLMIYDENNTLIYKNKKILELFDGEQLAKFEDINELDKWSQDVEEYNGIYIKPIEIDGEVNYYNIYKHEFRDNNAYIGVSYAFHNTTESIEKFTMIEEANEDLKRAANMKSDFLANMSHEIRTPMNAVIGMAEMALREEMTDQARDYLTQIKSSGRNLLNIINDILDFSKIESGKMDIIPEEYEPLSEFNDVANTLMTRIGDKNIELLIEENPAMPCKLKGDVLRIRQILINLANNAIKFTHHGRVQIVCDFRFISDDEIMLSFHVVDTGQGIKKEDLKKLFTSFQQVDTKRNRSVEGTGLGLAISKSLVETMGGTIGVESEYGKGSDFYFEIPQVVVDPQPSVTVNQPEKIFAMGMFRKKYLARRFFIDTSRMGVYSAVLRFYEDYDATCDMYEDMLDDRHRYLFFEENDYKDQIREILLNDPDLIGVMIAEFSSTFRPDLQNLRMIKKPFSTVAIAMALNNMELHLNNEEGMAFVSDFTAPDATIMIVDDNMVNLTVAEGLLEPLKMKIVCVASGKEAIDKINTEKFDIVFMDHMMPEMDGVETTHIIRRMYPELKDMPIIALTANAVSGVKEFFLKEGMNDFVPKPIEIRDIMSKVKQWLPEEKIKKGYDVVNLEEEARSEEKISIPGLDADKAMAMIGSPKLFMKILKEYHKNIPANHKQLTESYETENWENYTIQVHALKSSSRQIGAIDLADKAEKLENAGKAGDIDYIRANNREALDEYEALEPVLAPYCEDENVSEESKPAIDEATLKDILTRTMTACDDLDMDAMEAIVSEIRSYTYPDDMKETVDALVESAEIMDVFTCKEIAEKLIDM